MNQFQTEWATANKTPKVNLPPLVRLGVPALIWTTAVLNLATTLNPNFNNSVHNLTTGLTWVYIIFISLFTLLLTVATPLALIGVIPFSNALRDRLEDKVESYNKFRHYVADRMLPKKYSNTRMILTCVQIGLFLAGGAYICGLLLVISMIWLGIVFFIDREIVRSVATKVITAPNVQWAEQKLMLAGINQQPVLIVQPHQPAALPAKKTD